MILIKKNMSSFTKITNGVWDGHQNFINYHILFKFIVSFIYLDWVFGLVHHSITTACPLTEIILAKILNLA